VENARWKWMAPVGMALKIKRQGPLFKNPAFIALNSFLV
jgi:hypothetical protein